MKDQDTARLADGIGLIIVIIVLVALVAGAVYAMRAGPMSIIS